MKENINSLDSIQEQQKDQSKHHYYFLRTQLAPIARVISERSELLLDKLFSNLMDGNNPSGFGSILNWTYSIVNHMPSPICSKVINSQSGNNIAYQCYDCTQSGFSCICQECFVKGDHKGHNYIAYQQEGGCCDCGDQQSWNPKSFCTDHQKRGQTKDNIQPKTRKMFLEEYTLAFYVFFALNQLHINVKIKQNYGAMLISSLLKNANKNYQMKILVYELLQVTFSKQYVPLNDKRQLTILQRIFRSQQIDCLKEFPSLLFSILPVEQSRIKVTKQYFRKTNDMELHSQHLISTISSQYMPCAKRISRLIKDKQLQPLFLSRQKCPLNVKILSSIFFQYYWDLDYINLVKSAKQYNILHLKMVNVAQMAFYRQYGRISSSCNLNNLNIDQIYLKTLGNMVKDVINEKQILLKCIKELFYYIKNEGINKFSQAQERALGMFTLAFFDGDISQLFQKQIRQKFVQHLQISESAFATILKDAIKTGLKSVSLYGIPPTSNISLQNNFLYQNYQKNFNYFLDLIYHKILMMISIEYFRYDQTIDEMFLELIQCNISRKDQQLYSIKRAVKFLNTLTILDLDEIVISNYLKINQRQKIYNFYSRLLVSFKQLNIQQFKALALSIIKNQQSFEQFIKERTTIYKGNIINAVHSRPLETYVYNYLFQSYDKSILQTEVCLLNQSEDRSKYLTINIFSNNTIDILKQICKTFLQSLTLALQINEKLNELFSQISMEMFKIYFYSRGQLLKQYFQNIMTQDTRKIISFNLIKQILIVEKEIKEYETEEEIIKKQKEEINKKKRQKMQIMRREKTDLIRKKQQKFLMDLENKIDEQREKSSSNCIVCKQMKQQELNFISYVNFTDLIEKCILKNNVYPQHHLFFKTCGHKIHQCCYSSVCGNSPSKFCFLCKRQSNILVPELSLMDNMSLPQKQIKIKEFLSNIVPVLTEPILNEYFNEEDNEAYIKAIASIQSEEDNFISFINGFIRELAYTGLQNFSQFYKDQYNLYYQIFHMISCRPKSILQQTCLKIKQLQHKNIIFLESKLNSIQKCIMFLLQQSLQMKIDETDQKFFANLTTLQIQEAHKFMNIFTAGKSSMDLISITGLNMVSQINLFVTIPQNLNEFHAKMSSCLLCSKITNEIYMCLLCGWSACLKCKDMLFKHSNTDHVGGSISIACFDGGIKFFYGQNVFEDNSIYQDYLGTSYTQALFIDQIPKPQKFKLNRLKLREVYQIAIMHGIHQKVFGKK